MKQKNILYFRKEMEILRDAQERLIRYYPKLAPFLSQNTQDPDTERLIENFAILTSKIRQEMEDNIPFLAETLLNIIAPNFTTPIPAMCLQSFALEENSNLPYCFIPRGTKVITKYQDGKCYFKTLFDVHLYPLEVQDLTLQNIENHQILSLHIVSTNPNLYISDLKLSILHFFLGTDIQTSTTLLMWLFSYLDGIVLKNPVTQQEYKIPISSLKQLGLMEQESMFYQRNKGIEAFGLLQEFLLLPDKFNFFRLINLEVSQYIQADSFILSFVFTHFLPSMCMPKPHHFNLGVSPVDNTFAMSAEPITNDGKKDAYRIFIDRHHLKNYEILEIIKVSAHNVQFGRRALKNYKNYERFDFFEKNGDIKDFYTLQTKYSSDKVSYKEISFFNQGDTFVGPETISIDAYVCNADIPHTLSLGQIDMIENILGVKTKNITIPTLVQRCEIDAELMWRLVGFLTINIEGIVNKDTFLALLQVYNFHAAPSHHVKIQTIDIQKISQSLIDITSRVIYRIADGISKRGSLCVMQFNIEDFYCIGEVYRFGLVFSHFLKYFAPLNSFCELEIQCYEKSQLKHCLQYDCYSRV